MSSKKRITRKLFEESGRKGGMASGRATPEERSARAYKAWETKRKKAKQGT